MNFSTTPTFSNLGTIGSALQNRGLLNRNLDLGVTVPQHVILSGYHELSDAWAIMGDFGWENWSQFGKVDVAVTGGQNNPSLTTNVDYNDTYHVGVGTQYRLNPRVAAQQRVRLRFFHGISPQTEVSPFRLVRRTSSAWAPIG